MPDDLALLAPLDFPAPTVTCAFKGCGAAASKLVTCANKHCPSSWVPICDRHVHATLVSLSPTICHYCGRVSALRDFLIARPL